MTPAEPSTTESLPSHPRTPGGPGGHALEHHTRVQTTLLVGSRLKDFSMQSP